ncbi:MAG: alpha/beta fold hydrolase [Candidatus Dormibacteraeota bacterium]|nr:alpha/beta fold hydrolase [Candidatus Dormibacteraeota bacterium]
MRSGCRDIDVAWHDWGRGEPLVLVHGLADDHRAWRHVLPALALDHRVIAYDLRGHGETSLGDSEARLAQLADDLVAFLDVAGLGAPDLAGFSLGGTVVLKVAIDHPERVRRLIPIATSSRVGKQAAGWYQERAALAAEGADRLHPVLREDTELQLGRAPDLLEAHWRIRRESTADPRGFEAGCRAMARLHAEPLDPDLHRIKAPTLVVSAAEDPLCPPRAGEIIAAGVPGARMELIRGSGHQVEVERPAELAAIMHAFLAGA